MIADTLPSLAELMEEAFRVALRCGYSELSPLAIT